MGQRRVLGLRALGLADFQPGLGHRISVTVIGGHTEPRVCLPASDHLLCFTWPVWEHRAH